MSSLGLWRRPGKIVSTPPKRSPARWRKQRLHPQLPRTRDAVTVATLFVERLETGDAAPWQIGTLYTRAGRGEEALHYLELAYEERDPNMPSLSVDPIFDFLRDEPRFQALLDGLGLSP